MHSRQRKNLLRIWLVTTFLFAIIIMGRQISASPATRLSAPIVLEPTKTPGTTFSIDISISEVEKMWGYQFRLYYNTTVLTATGASSYAPFTRAWGPEDVGYSINDTTGYVELYYSMELGEKVGFATVDAKPISKIDFTVDTLGKSGLNFSRIYGETPIIATVAPVSYITAELHDGYFANVQVEVHDVAVTGVTAPATLEANETGTITVTVENQGDFPENFTVTVYFDGRQIGTPQTVTNLAAGSSRTFNITWYTADVAAGKYTVRAVASTVQGELDTVDNTFVDGEVTVRGGEWGGDIYLYAAIAIASIIVIVAILVYIRRSRKPKTA